MGIRIGNLNVSDLYFGGNKIASAWIGNTQVYSSDSGYLCFTANSSGSTVELIRSGSPSWTGSYSVDGTTWTEYIPSTTGAITLVSAGDKVYFKGVYTGSITMSMYLKFVIASGSVSASGNIMSFCCGDNYRGIKTIPYNNMFARLFQDCANLTTPPELPATTLSEACYINMFYGCTSLTIPPELPATTLTDACYMNMFYGCSNILVAPTLPSPSAPSYCYYGMFQNCTNLRTAPELPAVSVGSYCYDLMFNGCVNLIDGPSELPATTLSNYCYDFMFLGCEALINAPSIRATEVAPYCCYGMFSGCTTLTTAPSLLATQLAEQCYLGMFGGCTNLTTPPALPATLLASGCYANMFYGCCSLGVYSEPQSGYDKPWSIPTTGTAPRYTDSGYMFYRTIGDYASATSVNINTTFYTQNTPV